MRAGLPTAVAGVALALAFAAPASAQDFTVSSIDDTGGSLRQLVKLANATPGADTIAIPADTSYVRTVTNAPTEAQDTIDTGDIDITGDVTIFGMGTAATQTVLSASGKGRMFEISNGAKVTIRNLTITGGDEVGDTPATFNAAGGGVLLSAGELTLDDVIVRENRAGQQGGGVAAGGTSKLTIEDSRIDHNWTNYRGGGVSLNGDAGFTATIRDAVIASNDAPGDSGGGLANDGVGTMTMERTIVEYNEARAGGGMTTVGNATIRDSTIRGNHADFAGQWPAGGILLESGMAPTIERSLIVDNKAYNGGGLASFGVGATITNSTFSGNEATGYGGAVATGVGATYTLTHVTFKGNVAPAGSGPAFGFCVAPECTAPGTPPTIVAIRGSIVDNGGTACNRALNPAGTNLDAGASCGFGEGQSGTDPLLESLANNGGATLTHALADGSPAIDAAAAGFCPAVDQKAATRPAGPCDLGAYEHDASIPPVPPDTTITSSPTAPLNAAPVFSFTSNRAGATFECALDGGAFSSCASPFTLPRPRDGQHTFRVRAKRGTLVDPTPATASFFIDTIGPAAALYLTAAPGVGAALGNTAYSGGVEIHTEMADPEPASPGGMIRCALDPPTPPTRPDELPLIGCPRIVTALGEHTVYMVAVDGAGNAGGIANLTFRITEAQATPPPPPPAPTVTTKTVRGSCVREVDVEAGSGSACEAIYTLDAGKCPASGVTADGTRCDVTCPKGAKCTITTKVSASGAGAADRRSVPVTLNVYVSDFASGKTVASAERVCDAQSRASNSAYPKCPLTTTVTALGPADHVFAYCGLGAGAAADGEKLTITCQSTVKIEPAPVLDLVPGDQGVGVTAPGPGTLTVGQSTTGTKKTAHSAATAGTASKQTAARAAAPKKRRGAKKPLVATTTVQVKEAGPVQLDLKLSANAKKTLAKTGKLTVALTTTFTPAGGGSKVIKTQRVTLRPKAKCKPGTIPDPTKPKRCVKP